MVVKMTNIINQMIVEKDDIHTLQQMYDFHKEVKNRIENYPKAVELIQYFVNRVEEGSIRSKVTYQKFKQFLNEQSSSFK